MLSKLHWQKRTNRKSHQSTEGHNLSPQPSPELQSEGASQSPPRRPGFLSRVRSQRFSTANLPTNSSFSEAASNPVPKRHSYYQPAQPLYDTAEAQRPRTSTPDHFAPYSQVPETATAIATAGSEPSSPVVSIFTTGNGRGENLSAIWNPGQLIPDSSDSRQSLESEDLTLSAQMSINGADSLSSDSGQPLDRFMQRRLQRLNTEQGFREQRQASSQHSKSLSLADFHQPSAAHQHHQLHHPDQPLPVRIPQHANSVLASSTNTSATTPSSASPHFRHDTPQQPQYQPLRNFAKLHDDGPAHASTSPSKVPRVPSMASSNQNPTPAVAPINPVASQQHTPQHQTQQAKEVGRSTPQPQADELTEDQIRQLLNDHKELREKYQKVKKYYFEKEDQVKQLQNSLAHQRIAQSRTSLDDGEYATRFNRLDGLIAQLSFSIRKSWKSVPVWLTPAINKDAISIGKQEMTAVGRAFISKWLVEDVFDKYFHPDLDLDLSTQLKQMQNNIRLFAPPATVHEDEEYLTSKVVNWRLTTLEAMQDILRLPQAQNHRDHLTDLLKTQLSTALQAHLDNPPMSDLEGGVHMICELAVAMLGHLPLESRDVQIEYFLPGSAVNIEIMKIESGIPALGTSLADDLAEQGSTHSDIGDSHDATSAESNSRRRHMLSALTGHKKGHPAQGKLNGGSSTSLPGKDEQRVRLSVGIAAHVRERNILVKAPIFTTT